MLTEIGGRSGLGGGAPCLRDAWSSQDPAEPRLSTGAWGHGVGEGRQCDPHMSDRAKTPGDRGRAHPGGWGLGRSGWGSPPP